MNIVVNTQYVDFSPISSNETPKQIISSFSIKSKEDQLGILEDSQVIVGQSTNTREDLLFLKFGIVQSVGEVETIPPTLQQVTNSIEQV